jgi:hypothetical protein
MSKSIAEARKLMRDAFKKDPDFKRGYIDNVACKLMDNGLKSETGKALTHSKPLRDLIAEEIIDLIFD